MLRVDAERPRTHFSITRADGYRIDLCAASVLAKVQRDRDMLALDSVYPGYGFAKHKGYGTKQHLEALKTLGVTAIHRRSYAPVKALLVDSEQGH